MNQAETYAEIVAARSRYVSDQEYKQQLQTAYLEGMRAGLQLAASRIEGQGGHHRLWGFNADQVPQILASVIRDMVVELGGASDVD